MNVDLGGGLMKYSRSQQYARKALWRFAGKTHPVVKKVAKPITVVKKVNGAKNGGERVVNLLKAKSNYPTQPRVASRPAGQLFKNHKRSTRQSLTPGRIVILLAGRHKGKRVVLLKVSAFAIPHGPNANQIAFSARQPTQSSRMRASNWNILWFYFFCWPIRKWHLAHGVYVFFSALVSFTSFRS